MDKEIIEFQQEVNDRIETYGRNTNLKDAAHRFTVESVHAKYSYNFRWMGRPIIQYPQDLLAMQEIIWEVKPDLIIETGIAHGGSLIFYASMMELLSITEEINGEVLGIDIDIRAHNLREIKAHPMSKRIEMIQGSSLDEEVVRQVRERVERKKKVLVVLDSNHTHDHVLSELHLYANFTSLNSYCVVFDTFIEDMPDDAYPNRPWGKGNNPKSAVWEYLKENDCFTIDDSIHKKLLISVSPDGFLKRIK